MDIEEIRTFITLSECRNFTRTAEIMHVVQSTISNRIRSLEQYVGAELVVRDKSGIDLTNEGRIFLDYARRISDLDHTAIYEMNVLKKYTDRLSIAGPQWIMDYLINDPLHGYCLEHENIAINVSSGHSEDIIPHLKDDAFNLFGYLGELSVRYYRRHTHRRKHFQGPHKYAEKQAEIA